MKLTKKNLFKALAIALPLTLSVAVVLPIVVSCSSTESNDTVYPAYVYLGYDTVLEYTSPGGKWYGKTEIYIDSSDDFTIIAEKAFDAERNPYLKNVTTIDASKSAIWSVHRFAFTSMHNLKTVNLDNGLLRSLSNWVFSNINNERQATSGAIDFTFTIPKSMMNSPPENLPSSLFDNCRIKSVTFPEGFPFIFGLSGIDPTVKLILPNSIKTIKSYGMNSKINDVMTYLPNSIEVIEDFGLYFGGFTVLGGLVNLRSIGKIKVDKTAEDILFPNNGKLKEIGDMNFRDIEYDIWRSKSIIIPASVEKLGKISFYFETFSKTTFEVPSSLKSVWTQTESGIDEGWYNSKIKWY